MVDVVEDHFQVIVAEGGSRSAESSYEVKFLLVECTVEFVVSVE